MKKPAELLALISFFVFTSCGVSIKPVHLNSDPNEEFRDEMREQAEESDIEAFIATHPELDSETKKELRDGTLTRHAALERLNNKKNSHECAELFLRPNARQIRHH